MRTDITVSEAANQLIEITGFNRLVCYDLAEKLEDLSIDFPEFNFNPRDIAITFTSLTKRELVENYYTPPMASVGLPSDYVEYVINSDSIFESLLEYIEDNAGGSPGVSIVEADGETFYTFEAF